MQTCFGLQAAQQQGTAQTTHLGLLLGLYLISIHLLLQVTLGVLIDLDQINLLVGGVLGLSLELVQQVPLTDEVISLLALTIYGSLQGVDFPLQM